MAYTQRTGTFRGDIDDVAEIGLGQVAYVAAQPVAAASALVATTEPEVRLTAASAHAIAPALASVAPETAAVPPVETLSREAAMATAAQAAINGPLGKLDTQLLALFYENSAQAEAMSAFTSTVKHFGAAVSPDGRFVLIDTVASDRDGAALLAELAPLGLRGGSSYGAVVSGWLPVDKIAGLISLESLGQARESGFATAAGLVTTQADAAMYVDVARANFGVDGSGLRIGVLSDSFDRSGIADTFATNIASGDLPLDTVVLQDLEGSGSDEGRGMAQLIHDLAPGAAIDFATAFTGQAGFANNIVALAQAGDRVIVDDVFYFAEAYYQDGVIAQAVDRVTDEFGVVYFTLAGNHGDEGYQGDWVSGAATVIGGVNYTLMNFAPGEDYITYNSTANLPVAVHWDQPSASAGGAGSASDLNVFIFDSTGATLLGQTTLNNVGGDAVEVLGLAGNIRIAVGHRTGAGEVPTNIRIMALGNGAPVTLGNPASNQNQGTVYGHMNADTAITVGAAPYNGTPAFGVTPPLAETFSSRGFTSIYFDTNGDRLSSPEIRNGPDITAVDGGNTTFFGSDDGDAGTDPNFYGTSAAAPDAAAVGLLMLQVNPDLTRDDVLNLLQASAFDMQDPTTAGLDPGFDQRTGAGLINAQLAVQFASSIGVLAIANDQQTTIRGTHFGDIIAGSAARDTLYGLGGDDTISGGDANDRLFGGDGGDLLKGQALDDTLFGDSGNDTLFGDEGNDTLSGGNGNDLLAGGFGTNVINGGAGVNTVSYSDAAFDLTLSLILGTASTFDVADTLLNIQNVVGGAGNDSILGDGANNSLRGGAGNDIIRGNTGNDVIEGGDGNDVLDGASSGTVSTIGVDTVTYAFATAGVTVDLGLTSAQDTLGAGVDTLRDFDNLNGGAFNDTLTGSTLANLVRGGGGNDTLRGGGGTGDRLEGETGNDTLIGAVVLFGTVDQADLSKPQATVNNSQATAFVIGAGSYDRVNAAEILDSTTIPHATVNAVSTANVEWYAFTATAGDRVLLDIDNSPVDTVIVLTNAGGTILATNDDTSPVDPGSPTFRNSLIDVVIATSGTFYLQVGKYDASPSVPAPLVLGSVYRINLSVTSAATTSSGVPQVGPAMILNGGVGDDLIQSGSGDDAIDGGADVDTVSFALAVSGAMVNLALITPQATGSTGTDTIRNVENATGSAFGDVLRGDGSANVLSGEGGGDQLFGGDGNDALNGGTGNDYLEGGLLQDALNGGTGDDTLRGGGGIDALNGEGDIDTADFRDKSVAVVLTLAGAAVSTATVGGVADDTVVNVENIFGGTIADSLTGDGLANLFRGGGGADQINGFGGIDTIDFSDKALAVVLTLTGGVNATATVGGVNEDVVRNVENVTGGSAGDTLTGDTLANTLSGLGGVDTLRGGGGADRLAGGTGADVFLYGPLLSDSTVLATGRDTITDFANGDLIDLQPIDANTTLAGNQAFSTALPAGSAGRLTLTSLGGGSWLVQGYVDANATADFAIVVEKDVGNLVAADFLL